MFEGLWSLHVGFWGSLWLLGLFLIPLTMGLIYFLLDYALWNSVTASMYLARLHGYFEHALRDDNEVLALRKHLSAAQDESEYNEGEQPRNQPPGARVNSSHLESEDDDEDDEQRQVVHHKHPVNIMEQHKKNINYRPAAPPLRSRSHSPRRLSTPRLRGTMEQPSSYLYDDMMNPSIVSQGAAAVAGGAAAIDHHYHQSQFTLPPSANSLNPSFAAPRSPGRGAPRQGRTNTDSANNMFSGFIQRPRSLGGTPSGPP